MIREEGNEDIAEVGETPLPSAPERKLVSFFRLLPPSPQVHADLSIGGAWYRYQENWSADCPSPIT